ncbi:phenylacetate--CoA ligase family protein [Streptosporangium saharense]|uniref:Phenylacetate-CoA ligase n=1 Tax=Streptosporangium saharense TaxID=1706840 RepID=A0A7W7VQE3_9ACTN|nr:phenylacetate--CoA ligase family protein [Streptosporangium saharense]MBB4918927.1 phenylacetate-CoA ligase [Streptosporangium saharense]
MLLREAAYIPLTIARQYGGAAGLRRRQLDGINRMLAVARTRVPYYRDDPRYAGGPLRTLADLARLPVLDKQVLRDQPLERMIADGVDLDDCLSFQTSGSTGRRVRIVHDQDSHDYHMAACVRRFLATGRYLPTDRLSHIRPFAPPARMFERFNLFRRHVILSHRPMREIKEELLANRPKVLIGYPVHLRALLRALTPEEMARLRRTLRIVMTESELLLPEHRKLFAEQFGAPVFDEYSAFEVLNVTYDCRYGRAHLGEDRIYCEVVDDNGIPLPDGEQGHVVVTAFLERAMPLVRYNLGDIGLIEPGRCRCGRRFRTLRLTTGRSNDYVTLPSGERLYPDAFLHLAATHPGVSECFVHQDAEGLVRVHVVPTDEAGEGVYETVRHKLFTLAGGEFPLEVVPAETVRITVGGKGRFVTSDYAAPLT